MFDEIIRRAMNNSKDCTAFVQGDYYKPYFDDEPELKVIVCGVCGKPKEAYPFLSQGYSGEGKPPKDKRKYPFGIPVKVACLCDCEADKQRRAEQERQREKTAAQRKIECWGYEDESGRIHRNPAMENTVFESETTEKDNRHIKACRKYISTIGQRLDDGKGLFLCGKSGAGKTYAAMCFANAVMDRMFKCCFAEQWQITKLGQFDDKDRLEMKRYESCTFLIIDDFNPDKLNEYGREAIFNLFDARIKRGLPTVFTSNATESSIRNPIHAADKRITDRILDSCHIIEDSTHNYRRNDNGFA